MPVLNWMMGDGDAVPVGLDLAEIDLPEDFVYLGAADTRTFMELNENLPSNMEVATIAPISDEEYWFLVFEWEDIGYVKDTDHNDLDAEAILETLQEGSRAGNRELKKRGWAEIHLLGWARAPYYDQRTQNLTWATELISEGHRVVNHAVRLLGRRGVMHVTLVADPEEYGYAEARAEELLDGFRFQPGGRYAEYVAGTDRLAEVGLAALITGGAAAAALKSGLLARLWKFIVAGAVAVAAFVRRLFGGGRRATAS